MDGLRDDHREDPMPYGVDTIRLPISFPAAPASRGYNGRMWRMRPLRGWTGGQAASGEPAVGAEQGGSTVQGVASGSAGAVRQANAGSSLRATLDRVIDAMPAKASAAEAQGGGQVVKAASEVPAGLAPSADAASDGGGLTAQRPGEAPPAAAQAGPSPQPSPATEEHGRVWWWLHDHGLADTKHERADLLRKAMGPGSGRPVVDENGVPVNVEQLSDDEVIALDKKLRAPPYGLPLIGPAAPVYETPKPRGDIPKGVIDESKAKFNQKERRVAELLRDEGKYVEARERMTDQRTSDSFVNGHRVEFKTPDPGATNGTVVNEVQSSIKGGGQARDIIVDARTSGLSEAEARLALARISGVTRGKLDSVRIVGEGYDITGRYP